MCGGLCCLTPLSTIFQLYLNSEKVNVIKEYLGKLNVVPK